MVSGCKLPSFSLWVVNFDGSVWLLRKGGKGKVVRIVSFGCVYFLLRFLPFIVQLIPCISKPDSYFYSESLARGSRPTSSLSVSSEEGWQQFLTDNFLEDGQMHVKRETWTRLMRSIEQEEVDKQD